MVFTISNSNVILSMVDVSVNVECFFDFLCDFVSYIRLYMK